LVLITAEPTVAVGSVTYEFDHWSSNDNGAADPEDVAELTPTQVFIFMDGDKTVTAYYNIYFDGVLQYYLTLETFPPEILAIDPETVSGEGYHPSGVLASFSAKETVTDLNAMVRWKFVRWTLGDNLYSEQNTAEQFMDGGYTFVAEYGVDSYYLGVVADPPVVQAVDSTAVSGAGWYHSGSYGIVDAKQTVISGSYRYEFSHWLYEDQYYDEDDNPVDLPGNQAAHFMDSAYTMVAVYNVLPSVEWESSFKDSSSGNSLKISTDDKLFEFSTPEKTYPIKQADVLTVRGSLFIIWHRDSDLIVVGAGILDPRIDFCLVYIRDVQSGKTYLVRDRIGPD
jgi:hypothetical protein